MTANRMDNRLPRRPDTVTVSQPVWHSMLMAVTVATTATEAYIDEASILRPRGRRTSYCYFGPWPDRSRRRPTLGSPDRDRGPSAAEVSSSAHIADPHVKELKIWIPQPTHQLALPDFFESIATPNSSWVAEFLGDNRSEILIFEHFVELAIPGNRSHDISGSPRIPNHNVDPSTTIRGYELARKRAIVPCLAETPPAAG